MNNIDNLNEIYQKKKSELKALEDCYHLMLDKKRQAFMSQDELLKQMSYQMNELFRVESNLEYDMLIHIKKILEGYMDCLAALKDYRIALQGSIKSNDRSSLSISNYNLKKKQKRMTDLVESFNQYYQLKIQSMSTLPDIVLKVMVYTFSTVKKEIDDLKTNVKELLDEERINTDLQAGEPIEEVFELPDEMIVARLKIKQKEDHILNSIHQSGIYQPIRINLKDQGNLMISTSYQHMKDREVDSFVLSYILSLLTSFPLGSLHVHIFDKNINYLYQRLYNAFQNENASDSVKKVIQLHTDLNDLYTFKDVICPDIFKKTSIDYPDLYSIYSKDKSDQFNLIVIRDGLTDSSGYVSNDLFDIICSLTNPADTGHKCGLRFLIIDSSQSFENAMTNQNKYLIKTIKDNCELIIGFDRDKFCYKNEAIEVLRVNGDLEEFVQERATTLVNLLSGKDKNIISLEDVQKEQTSHMSSIMYIPVGVSGDNVIELPLSCKDDEGTVAGQCIGYMAIGRSGSGKSSFFHSLVLNGCKKYSPKDLQFWLLDFKNGGASSKYRDSNVPHIRIIAENNKIDDALCLFQMILEEMERRTRIFNDHFCDNIIDYNQKAQQHNRIAVNDTEKLEYFPRIIVAIDEVQEIFRDDNSSKLKDLISSISTRMRSSGIHFVMVAQNLSEGRSYFLKESFLPSASGRICFRVEENMISDSGFKEEFIQRRKEIADLSTGEAYISYGKGTIKKVKMAYTSNTEMKEVHFVEIRNKYRQYADMKPLIIGSKKRLSIDDYQQGTQEHYADIISRSMCINNIHNAVIGEDVYRMSPLNVKFSQYENSSLLLLGSDKQISSSICTSIGLSLSKQNVTVHLFNADRTKIRSGYEAVPHSFMYFCQNIGASHPMMHNYRLDQLRDVVGDIYKEYLTRQDIIQHLEDDETDFSPIFLIINDLFGIECFNSNEQILIGKPEETKENREESSFIIPIYHQNTGNREEIQIVMNTLLNKGYRYNIHLILAMRESSNWRSLSRNDVVNTIYFNSTDVSNQQSNLYYIKEMLKNISNHDGSETRIVWVHKNTISKVRPIIYNMTSDLEKETLMRLMK